MKTHRILASLALLPLAALAADVPPVIAPPARATSLATLQKLLAPRDAAAPADMVDPFHSDSFANAASAAGSTSAAPTGAATTAAVGSVRTGPRSAQELLATIADALRPGGYIVMGGQPSLSFGQKRVKPGGTLTITFEGAEYTLEVVSIDRANFTLRLNNEEYTRPIKK